MRDYRSKNGNLGAIPIVRSIDLSLAAFPGIQYQYQLPVHRR